MSKRITRRRAIALSAGAIQLALALRPLTWAERYDARQRENDAAWARECAELYAVGYVDLAAWQKVHGYPRAERDGIEPGTRDDHGVFLYPVRRLTVGSMIYAYLPDETEVAA